jgi:hypothetical protein
MLDAYIAYSRQKSRGLGRRTHSINQDALSRQNSSSFQPSVSSISAMYIPMKVKILHQCSSAIRKRNESLKDLNARPYKSVDYSIIMSDKVKRMIYHSFHNAPRCNNRKREIIRINVNLSRQRQRSRLFDIRKSSIAMMHNI